MSKNLGSLKEILTGTGDKEPQPEAVAQMAQEFYNTDALILLVANLQKVDFEVGGSASAKLPSENPESHGCDSPSPPMPSSRPPPTTPMFTLAVLCTSFFSSLSLSLQGKKDVVYLFSNIVRRQIGTRSPTVESICSKPEILYMLLRG